MSLAQDEVEAKTLNAQVWLSLGFVLLVGLPTLLYPLAVDQGVFSYIGHTITQGGVPYRDAWDIKPPAIFFIYALGWLITPNFDLAPRILDILAAVWTGYLLIRLCARMGNPKAGPYAAFFFGLLYFYEFNFWHTAQAESFAAPFTVLGILFALKAGEPPPEEGRARGRNALFAGMCFGFLICLKTTLAVYGLIPISILPAKRNFKSGIKPSIWLGVGLAAVPCAFLLYFAAHGAIGDLLTVFQAQAAYAQSAEGFDSDRFRNIVFGLGEFYRYTYAGSLLALGAMLFVPKLRKTGFLWVWMIAFWIELILQNKYFEYHFVPWLLPVAVCLGYLGEGLRQLMSRLPTDFSRFLAHAGLTGLFALLVIRNLTYFVVPIKLLTGAASWEWHDRLYNYNFYDYVGSKKAARIVRSVSTPDDRILVYAFDPTIYLMSGRESVTRHISNAPIRLYGWFPLSLRQRFFEQLKSDVLAHPPKVFVTDFQWDWGIGSSWSGDVRDLTFCELKYKYVGAGGHDAVYVLVR